MQHAIFMQQKRALTEKTFLVTSCFSHFFLMWNLLLSKRFIKQTFPGLY